MCRASQLVSWGRRIDRRHRPVYSSRDPRQDDGARRVGLRVAGQHRRRSPTPRPPMPARRLKRGGRPLLVVVALSLVMVLGSCDDATQPQPEAKSPTSRTPEPADVTDPDISAFLDKKLPAGASGTLVAADGDGLVHCAGFGTADRAAGTLAHLRHRLRHHVDDEAVHRCGSPQAGDARTPRRGPGHR